MIRAILHICRQVLLGIIALQILNLSVGNAFTGDEEYDYSYTYNKTYDPTETAVEWIVELNYGQQPGFSYDVHQDGTKCLLKTFHWKTDLRGPSFKPLLLPTPGQRHIPFSDDIPIPSFTDILSPPPERPFA